MTEPTGVAPAGNPSDGTPSSARSARFGVFELDLRTGELRRDGVKLKLQEQPFRLLAFLLEHAGDVVTREELRERLWPAEFVDFDHGLNTAIRKLRTVLDDSADNPRFVETLARRGYRFIAPVTWTLSAEQRRAPAEAPSPAAQSSPKPRGSPVPVILAAASITLIILLATHFFVRRSSSPSPRVISSVAVLPFATAERQHEHVSDGLTEVLIDTLSRIPDLRVTARTTVFHYKGTRFDPRRAGEELKVDAIVTGVVRRQGDGFSLRVELISVRDGTQMWGERYTATAGELPQVQSRISQDLTLRLREGVRPGPRPVYTANAEAYDLYLKGLYLWNSRGRANVKQSVDHFTRATQLDPKFAAAYGSLANAYGVMVGHGALTPEEGTLKVMAAATRALQLDPSNAEAHASLATTKFRNLWDFEGAERDYRRAIAANPSYATAHQWYSDYLRSMGRPVEAMREIETAYRLDPFSAPINSSMCFHLYLERRYQDAIAWNARVGGINQRFGHPGCVEASYLAMNDYDRALEVRIKAADTPEAKAAMEAVASAYRRSGQQGMLEKRIEQLKTYQSKDTNVPIDLAEAYAALRNNDEAFAWLEKAFDSRLTRLTSFHIDPAFDNLRNDPRFDDLRQRIGLPKVAGP